MAGAAADTGSPLTTRPAASSTWTLGTCPPTGIGIGSGSEPSLAAVATAWVVPSSPRSTLSTRERWYSARASVPHATNATAASAVPVSVSRRRRCRSRIAQPVAGAADRLHQRRFVRLVDLAAQRADVHLDHVVVRRVALAPDVVEQLLLGDDRG